MPSRSNPAGLAAFRKYVNAYCRENGLPQPIEGSAFVNEGGVDLLLAPSTDEAGAVIALASLGKVADYPDEERLLALLLKISAALGPLQGTFLGLDERSRRILMRTRFREAEEGDPCEALTLFLGEAAIGVEGMKDMLRKELGWK